MIDKYAGQIIAALLVGGITAVTLGWSQIQTNTHDLERHERVLIRIDDKLDTIIGRLPK